MVARVDSAVLDATAFICVSLAVSANAGRAVEIVSTFFTPWLIVDALGVLIPPPDTPMTHLNRFLAYDHAMNITSRKSINTAPPNITRSTTLSHNLRSIVAPQNRNAPPLGQEERGVLVRSLPIL
jgi:hypothetical protein